VQYWFHTLHLARKHAAQSISFEASGSYGKPHTNNEFSWRAGTVAVVHRIQIMSTV
jgi:hypothetical protein